jgi:hypothetical protein
MAVQLRRKIYPRGGSYETTIPLQLLFSLDLSKKHDIVFEFDPKSNKWFVDFRASEPDKDKRKIKK